MVVGNDRVNSEETRDVMKNLNITKSKSKRRLPSLAIETNLFFHTKA